MSETVAETVVDQGSVDHPMTTSVGLDDDESQNVIIFSTMGLKDPKSDDLTPDEMEVAQAEWDARERFELPKQAAKVSNLFKTALEDNKKDTTPDEAEEIICPTVSEEILRFVIEYLAKHDVIGYKRKPDPEHPDDKKKTIPANILSPLKHDTFAENVTNPWDVEFVNRLMAMDEEHKGGNFVAKKRLFDAINAANYLNIEPLLWLLCGKLANIWKGKKPKYTNQLMDMSIPLGEEVYDENDDDDDETMNNVVESEDDDETMVNVVDSDDMDD